MKCSLLANPAVIVAGLAPLAAAGAQTAVPPNGARGSGVRATVPAAAADTAARHTAATPAAAPLVGPGVPRVHRRRHAAAVRTPTELPREVAAAPEAGGQVVTFGFAALGADGAREPVLRCAVLRACVVDLEPGERLLVPAPIIGDAVRWRAGVAATGPGGSASIVWIKPTDCGLATNLVLPTDRRVYHVALDSGPCGAAGARVRYVSRARFTYPDDSTRTTGGGIRTAATAGVFSAAAQALAGIPVDALRLNFSYDLRRDRRFPWSPARVFDDGAHTFIQLPPEADAYAAPALFELDDGGGKTLLNYVVRDGFYVTDRTFRRALLVVGQGKQEQRFELGNRAYGRAPAPVPAASGRRSP